MKKNSLIKRVLALTLSVCLVVGGLSLTAFGEDAPAVVDRGFCGQIIDGAPGENMQWVYYDNRELVISGTGFMDWYYVKNSDGKRQPWYDYLDEITEITVCEGVNSIGSYAFRLEDDRRADFSLRTVHLPASLTAIYNDVFYKNVIRSGMQTAVVFAGSRDEWNRINNMSVSVRKAGSAAANPEEWVAARTDVSAPPVILPATTVLFYDGKAPESFCKISGGDATIFNDSSFYRFCTYYLKNDDEKAVWSVEGDSVIIESTEDARGQISGVTLSGFKRGNATLKVEIVNSAGEVTASDECHITSARPAKGDSFKTILSKLSFSASTAFGFSQLAGVFGLMYIEMAFLWLVDKIAGIFR